MPSIVLSADLTNTKFRSIFAAAGNSVQIGGTVNFKAGKEYDVRLGGKQQQEMYLVPSAFVSVAKYSKTLSGPLRSRIRFSYLKNVLCLVERGRSCQDCSMQTHLALQDKSLTQPCSMELTSCIPLLQDVLLLLHQLSLCRSRLQLLPVQLLAKARTRELACS